MPQIVQNTDGDVWVGMQLYPGERYISFDKVRVQKTFEQITLEPTITEIKSDIEKMLRISADETSPVFLDVVKMLCLTKVGDEKKPVYFRNSRAKFGVSKINS